MAKFRLKPMEAVQLRWDNWSEVCEFARVGKLSEGKPEGCFLDPVSFSPLAEKESSDVIGLKIPSGTGVMIAKESDYIVRGTYGELFIMWKSVFENTYEPDC